MSGLAITPEIAGPLHDGLCRAIDQGLRIERPPEHWPATGRTYWTVDSVSDPGSDYLVMVEQHAGGVVLAYCECAHCTMGHKVCKHIALCLDEMGLIPRTERV